MASGGSGGRRRRGAVLAAGAALALLASGCASIPMDGETGTLEVDEPMDGLRSEIEPDGPEEGAQPSDIVRGFLAAGVGYSDDFAVARSFLTEDFAREWDPQAGVVVMAPETSFDSVTADVTSDQQDVTLPLPVAASVDSAHVYRERRRNTSVEREFSLRQVNGEWRISEAPDGLVLTSSSFGTVFSAYQLYFYTPGLQNLVPDTRWFIRSTSTATELVNALLAGPAEHLDGAVVSAVPDGTRLEQGSVTVEGGVAEVSLDSSAQALDGEDAERLVTQISETLRGLSSTTSVEVSSPAGELSSGAGQAPPVGVQTDQRPVLVSGGRLARLADTRIEPLGGLPDPPADISDPAVSFDEEMYAYLAAGGTELHRVLAEAGEDEVMVTDAEGLVGPSFDRFGNVWTSARDSPHHFEVVRSSGETATIAVQWLADRSVRALGVSRDGTRLAVLSANGDGIPQIDVIGIVRNSEGEPSGLTSGTPLRVGAGFDEIADVTWAGSSQLAVLASERAGGAAQPHLVGVGGPGRELGEVEGGASITASTDTPSIRVTTEDGELYSFGSDSWQKVVDLVAFDPAYPG
ncbi:LpqB family beta-propeller domain-containing protein [Brevibacterium album]|uniref:LpqB family beta-propeller domain-containing protein n=1 Tax=Brevibacterium album TaxID=417948 RepID=UPI0004161605|nr:LpqB family beta-propeller domain-containing protein [Brevibacterium album]